MTRRQQLDRIENLLQRLDAAVVVRDLGNARAAEAFDGLRKQVIQSGKNHRSHVTHLLSLRDSIEKGATLGLVSDRVNDFLMELGIMSITDTSDSSCWDVVEGDGPILECITPAIVELLADGQFVLHRPGRARASHPPAAPLLTSPVAEQIPAEAGPVETNRSSGGVRKLTPGILGRLLPPKPSRAPRADVAAREDQPIDTGSAERNGSSESPASMLQDPAARPATADDVAEASGKQETDSHHQNEDTATSNEEADDGSRRD